MSVSMLVVLLFFVCKTYAQESRTEVCIDFRVNSMSIDSTYSDNAARIRRIVTFLQEIGKDSSADVVRVSFCGAASPEGSYQLNSRLARGRRLALEGFVRRQVDIPDTVITRDDGYIPWDYLKAQIEGSDLRGKEAAVAIIEGEARLTDYDQAGLLVDSRIARLKQLDGGRVWRQIDSLYFSRMRNACAVIVTVRREIPHVQEDETVADTIDVVAAMAAAPAVEAAEAARDVAVATPLTTATEEPWRRGLHLKTNVLGWGLAIANAAVEIDLARHWSFTLPVYYSAWDYFKTTIKFRTFALQPEVRYWASGRNGGFFAGAHFGLAYYNLATDGAYRYQDHSRKTPALGGGVGIGYRLPLGGYRWRVEFSVGAGIYSLRYDKFRNTPRTKDGLLVEGVKKTYWGIDQAAVSFSYTIGLGKGGGRQ